jgi:threonine/homoserine/homoserine lactone efflux protein
MLGTQDLWIFISAGVALNLVPGQDFVFIAFVPQFIAADAPNLRLSFLFLGFIFSFNGLVWCLIVAWFFAHIGAQLNPLSPISLWINRLAGSLLAYFGISLLMSSGH